MKRDLLARARSGLNRRGRPKSVTLRRAVSDSYYALFHALCQLSSDTLVGIRYRNTEAWRRLYRGHSHGHMKDELKKLSSRHGVDASLKRIAAAFIELQESRHLADYDPWPPYKRREEVEYLIAQAEAAIDEVDGLAPEFARQLASAMLVQNRSK